MRRSTANNQILSAITQAALTAFIVTLMVFLALRLVPGDPVDLMLGENSTSGQHEIIRHKLGLDQSLPHQLGSFLNGLAHGNLGESFTLKKSVLSLIRERLPNTVLLALFATVLANLIGIPFGAISAWSPKSFVAKTTTTFSLLVLSLPTFWLGPLLVLTLCFQWPWLPVQGFDSFKAIILPTMTLGLGMSAIIIRTTHAAVRSCLRADYLQTARAKGNPEWRVLFLHVLPNAAIPILMVSTLQFGNLLAGAVVTESIFDWPGIGSLAYEAISSRDYPTIQGTVLIIALNYVVINMMTEIVRKRFSPAEEGSS